MLSHIMQESVTPVDLRGVFSVPPLPRTTDSRRSIDFDAAEQVARHLEAGGIHRFLYGGNAFLYHITLPEYEALLDWLAGFGKARWAIPSVGPSFGRAMDQACLLRRHAFRCAMVLPCGDPRDPMGMEAGLREIAHTAGLPLILYLKTEDGFGSDTDAGLDAIGRLIEDGVAVAIKYAVTRDDPAATRTCRACSGAWTGRKSSAGWASVRRSCTCATSSCRASRPDPGCIAPRLCNTLFDACVEKDWARAEAVRAAFMPLEDLRDAWGPARVLHHATELAGIAAAGPIPPYVSPLDAARLQQLAPVARTLLERNA